MPAQVFATSGLVMPSCHGTSNQVVLGPNVPPCWPPRVQVEVRKRVACDPPRVVRQPAGLMAQEGGTAELLVDATVGGSVLLACMTDAHVHTEHGWKKIAHADGTLHAASQQAVVPSEQQAQLLHLLSHSLPQH